METKNIRLQTVLEYLVTYSWAIAILLVVLTIIYVVFFASQLIVQLNCNFQMNFNCQNGAVVSNAIATRMLLIATNMQQYPVANVLLSVNSTGLGGGQGLCSPNYVLPGGLLVCNMTMNVPVAVGSSFSAKLLLQEHVCMNINASVCSQGTVQSIQGTLQSRVLSSFNFTPFSIVLTPNMYYVVADGSRDLLTATTKFLGYPLQGATVNFTKDQSFPVMAPVLGNSDSNGKTLSYISSTRTGIVNVNAMFLGYSSNAIIKFVTAVSPVGSSLMQIATTAINGTAATTAQCSFQQPVVAGDLLVFTFGISSQDRNYPVTYTTVTDQLGSTFTPITSTGHSSGHGSTWAGAWYTVAGSGGFETITVTYDHGPSGMFCFELTPPFSLSGIRFSVLSNDGSGTYVNPYSPSIGSTVLATVAADVGNRGGGLTPGSGFAQADYQQPVNTSSEYLFGWPGGSTTAPFTLTQGPGISPAWAEVSVSIPSS